MAVATDPTPADLPLPGGRSGATVRVHPLLTGEVSLPPHALERPTGSLAGLRRVARSASPRGRQRIPVPAFLVEHPQAGPLLVDTGLHASVAIDPKISLGRLQQLTMPFRASPGQSAPEQLRARGVEPEQVSIVVMTHLHNDHASGVAQFPSATFVVSAIEWRVACAGGFAQGYRHAHFDNGFDWRTVDYADPAIGGHGPFNRCIDLFGDGSVRLVFTPGHTRGHQSVLLTLDGGRELLLTGDAAYARRSVDEDLVPIFCVDEHLYRDSLQRIRAFVEGEPEGLVICGHDAEMWPSLQPVY